MNIVLIGMPGSGKSCIGKKIAVKTDKNFVDTDSEIVNKTGISIPDIFSKYGEKYFRNLEADIIKEVAKRDGQVIAVGGGAVLREENVGALSQNGILVWIDREIARLETDGRPLSKDADALMKMYDQRRDIYASSSKLVIKNDGTPEKGAENVILGVNKILNNNRGFK